MKKTETKKSSATVPLRRRFKNECYNFRNSLFLLKTFNTLFLKQEIEYMGEANVLL